MKMKAPMMLGLAVLILAACGEQTRDGQLTLTGSAPVRFVDEGGKTLEFGAGPTKVEFSAGSSRKFTVTVSQGKEKKAKFSGKAPASDDSWNFTLRGKDIGQPTDLTSARNLELYGKPWRQIGDGGFCGYNGHWVTEDTYQKCNEDWNVAFNDAATAQSLGNFHSRRENLSCMTDSRIIYCREDHHHDHDRFPHPRRPLTNAQESVKRLSDMTASGVRFD